MEEVFQACMTPDGLNDYQVRQGYVGMMRCADDE
jgi:hypothetical protein